MYCKNHCYSVQIRASVYKLVVSLCQYCGDFVPSHGRQFCPLVLSSLGEKEPGVVGPLWDAVLLTTSLCQVNNTQDNLFGNCCWNPIHQQKFCFKSKNILSEKDQISQNTVHIHICLQTPPVLQFVCRRFHAFISKTVLLRANVCCATPQHCLIL